METTGKPGPTRQRWHGAQLSCHRDDEHGVLLLEKGTPIPGGDLGVPVRESSAVAERLGADQDGPRGMKARVLAGQAFARWHAAAGLRAMRTWAGW